MWEVRERKWGDVVVVNLGREFKKKNWFGDG